MVKAKRREADALPGFGEHVAASFEHPYVFVRCRRTGETYRFLVADNGRLEHEGAQFDLGHARRTAIAYLAGISRPQAA